MHSKIIISDIVGFFTEFEAESPNRNTVKQTAEMAKIISGDEDVAGITSVVPGIKNSRLQNGLE